MFGQPMGLEAQHQIDTPSHPLMHAFSFSVPFGPHAEPPGRMYACPYDHTPMYTVYTLTRTDPHVNDTISTLGT